ncbi:hypothetical protein CGRA01v4_00681 [Colletotrichum graminicola]|nr:hypothetical protein CGRA01v4_00681 [Colletotrichum graminicola]
MGDIALSFIGLSCAQTGVAVSAWSEVFLGCVWGFRAGLPKAPRWDGRVREARVPTPSPPLPSPPQMEQCSQGSVRLKRAGCLKKKKSLVIRRGVAGRGRLEAPPRPGLMPASTTYAGDLRRQSDRIPVVAIYGGAFLSFHFFPFFFPPVFHCILDACLFSFLSRFFTQGGNTATQREAGLLQAWTPGLPAWFLPRIRFRGVRWHPCGTES